MKPDSLHLPRIGDHIRLLSMDDPQAPPQGMEGVVESIDDLGTIHVRWDNGSHLGLVPGIDRWTVIRPEKLFHE